MHSWHTHGGKKARSFVNWCSKKKDMINNSYWSLDEKGKKKYIDKLSCVGFSLRYDPTCRWHDHGTWLKVEYGHIVVNYIKRTGMYTPKQLPSWKTWHLQLLPFNCFCFGTVRISFRGILFDQEPNVVLKTWDEPRSEGSYIAQEV